MRFGSSSWRGDDWQTSTWVAKKEDPWPLQGMPGHAATARELRVEQMRFGGKGSQPDKAVNGNLNLTPFRQADSSR
jgi:hypothetical protein